MGKEKKYAKRGLGERIICALDMQSELLPHKTLIEIHGEELVKIQGAGSILCYRENEIRIALRGKKGFLSVIGDDLCCSSYNMGVVGIEGKIYSVNFGKDEKENKDEHSR